MKGRLKKTRPQLTSPLRWSDADASSARVARPQEVEGGDDDAEGLRVERVENLGGEEGGGNASWERDSVDGGALRSTGSSHIVKLKRDHTVTQC
jgi:hypothetical protein